MHTYGCVALRLTTASCSSETGSLLKQGLQARAGPEDEGKAGAEAEGKADAAAEGKAGNIIDKAHTDDAAEGDAGDAPDANADADAETARST